MRIMSVVVAALTASAVVSAAYGKTVSLSPLGDSDAAAKSDESDTVKVQGRGVGMTKADALKDAYRDAIERAVGLYVDAETVAKNDEIVQDQVLTHSNAYIEKYDELGTKKLDGGLVQVRIAATVKKRELAASLKKVLPSQTANNTQYTGDLKDIHAQIVSKEKRDADGYKLLQNALMGFDSCTLLAVPSVDMTHKQVIKEGKISNRSRESQIPEGQVVLRVLLRLKFAEDKYYNEFVPVVKSVLDQIASSSKNVKLSLLETTELADYPGCSALDDYLDISGGSQVSSRRRLKGDLMDSYPCMSPMRVLYGGGVLMGMEGANYGFCNSRLAPKTGCKAVQFVSGGYSHGRGWDRRNETNPFMFGMNGRRVEDSIGVDEVLSSMSGRNRPLNDHRKQQLILVCGVNKAHTVWDAVFYEVDRKSAAAFMLWCNKYGSGSSGSSNNDRAQANSIKYNVSYCDKSGDCVLVNAWHIPRVCIMNADWGSLGHRISDDDINVLYISPFLGCYSEEFVQWHDVLIKTDMLQEIESVKIELAD